MSDTPSLLYVRPADEGTDTATLDASFAVTRVGTAADALSALADSAYDGVVCEQDLPGDQTGLDVLAAIREHYHSLPVVLTTAEPDGVVAARATRLDVTEYVPRSEAALVDRLYDVVRRRSDDTSASTDPPAAAVEPSDASTLPPELADSFDAIAGSISEAVVTIDAESEVIYANEAVTDLTGYGRGDLVGNDFMTLVPDHLRSAHRERLQRYLDTGCRNADQDYLELPLVTAAGEELTVAVSFSDFERDGRRYCTGVLRDTSDQTERERAIETTTDALRALTELATEGELSESRTVERVLEIGLQRLGLSFGYLSRVEGGVHEIVTTTGEDPPLEPGLETPLEGTYCRRVLDTGELLTVADAETEGWDDVYQRSGVSCYVGGLITVGGEPYGTLCFGDETPRATPYSESETAFIELLVEWVSREFERRHRADELERYENIIEAVDDGVYALDSTGHFEFVNQAMTDLTGYSEEELLGSYTGFIKNDEVVDRATSIVQEMIFDDRDDEESFELEIQHASGTSFPAEDHMTLLYDDDDRFAGTAGVIRDITEQKKRDEALSGLLDTTRSLMQAHTPEAVAETVVEATESDLGFTHSLVRLYDAEADTLWPVAASDDVPERPTYDADEGYPGEAFQRSEPVVVDDFDQVETYGSDELTASMYIPLGEHGVMSIGVQNGQSLTDSDVSVAEILASNAAAALDRVEREKSLLRYESVVENVRDMVYVLDDNDRFQLVTEPLAEWLGFEQSSLLGRNPSVVADTRTIDEHARRIEELREGDGGGSITLETTLETASGEKRPAEVAVSLLDEDRFRGTVGVVRDLTELKETRAELEDERDRFSYLYNTLPDAVIETETVDGESVVRSVNPAFSDVFGYDADAAVDQPLSALLRLPDAGSADELPQFDDRQTNGDPFQTELRLMTETGFRDFLFRGVPYSRDGDSVSGFGIYTDITDQRERERRLKLLNRVLRHNLRNDLTVVIGMADALEERITDAELTSILDRLRRKAEEVASLSERAREMERSVRRDQFGTDPVDVPTVASDVVSSFSQDTNGRIETDLPDASIAAGDGRLHRVISELLENSLEHAGTDPTVRLSVTADSRTVSIVVADDGPGIPQHELDVVTGDEPITQLRHGTGLGLWLVVWVTETYGGTVEFDTDPDRGTVVTVELPRTDA